jgi:exodeoxyribonuclease VII small subunit
MADATSTDGSFPDIAEMRYEDAREELIGIVTKLEAGQAPLEDSMHLWRRGEALAAHCSTWLDGAQAEIERATRPAAAAGDRSEAVRADDAVFDDDDA